MKPRLIALSIILCIPILLSFILPTRAQLLNMKSMSSLQIQDRNGVLLREVLSQHDATSRYATLENISPWLIHATLCREDKRFFMHKGIDLLAITRALLQNLYHGRILSGGSTITQQLSRNMLASPSRSIVYKLMEACFAVNMELKLSKYEILELYFNYAPYSNQTYGIEAASHLYFRKPARDLSMSEAVFLAGIPKAPSFLNPYKYPERIAHEYDRIINSLYNQSVIDSIQYFQARFDLIKLVPRKSNFKAPHFCEYIQTLLRKEGHTNAGKVKTTLDSHLQEETSLILRNNIERLEDANVTNAAALILDRQSMDILTYIGSLNFFDPLIDGEVDGVQSLRQPGSALKPFTYAIALEKGAHASTLIPDMPTYKSTLGGDYRPRNYDKKYHGLVRLRTALACSYNIPAVQVCGSFGTEMLLERLRLLGFESLNKSPGHYGVGLTLGNGEVTLLELTRAYGVFALYGHTLGEHAIITLDSEPYIINKTSKHVFASQIAYIITDILADNNARSPAFGEYSPLNLPFFCAIKTGTSKDYRDNWCVGFTESYIVGVWVGNFDGSPMQKVSGITGAAPIFRDIILMLHYDQIPGKLEPPIGLTYQKICTTSGELAQEHCDNCMQEMFVPGCEPERICYIHTDSSEGVNRISTRGFMVTEMDPVFTIKFPDDRDIFKIDPILRKEYQRLRFQIATSLSLKKVTWYIDDKNIGTSNYPYSVLWQLIPGQHVIIAEGITKDSKMVQTPPVNILVLK